MGQRLHAINNPDWNYEKRDVRLGATRQLLVRVMIGKIDDEKRLLEIFEKVPIRADSDPDWNCVIWVKEALEALGRDDQALKSGVTDWIRVRDSAMTYCQQKRDDRRWDRPDDFDMTKAPTYDLLKDKEMIP